MLTCKEQVNAGMLFRVILLFVWITAGSQAGTSLLLPREARFVRRLSIRKDHLCDSQVLLFEDAELKATIALEELVRYQG